MTFNAHWFWDDKAPHEGQVFGDFDKVYHSTTYVDIKAFSIAQVIINSKADIVGLVEIENKYAIERIKQYLTPEWEITFKQGRDSYTGQDVGILSRIPIDIGSSETFPNIKGKYKNTSKTPSKILGASFNYEGKSYYIILAHLLSKRNSSSSKDRKRAAQANAILQIVNTKIGNYDHLIVMGDLNDTPGSTTLKELRGQNAIPANPVLLQTADVNDTDFYSIKKYKSLIDHILISESLKQDCNTLQKIETGPISDHYAMLLNCSNQ